MKKKCFAIFLSIVLSFGVLPGIGARRAQAASSADNAGRVCFAKADVRCAVPVGGYLPIQRAEFPAGRMPEGISDIGKVTASAGSIRMQAAGGYGKGWGKYSNYYFYNHLSSRQKKFYDNLKKLCEEYLTTTISAMEYGDGLYVTRRFALSEGLSVDEMTSVYQIFCLSNPQYYFLNTMAVPGYDSSSNSWGYVPGVYGAFADGVKRKKATEAVQKQLTAWEKQIKKVSGTFNKVKTIHDLIADKVSYNYIAYDPGFSRYVDEKEFTQTAYSVFCMNRTVCAGYSEAFEMLCNGAGIPAVAVTSAIHEWNLVRINGSWYNVDLTFDDSSDEPCYLFFARNNRGIRAYDTECGEHKTEACWNGKLPACTLDSRPPDFCTPGKISASKGRVSKPKITISGGKVKITCAASGAKIYYTTDKSTPSPTKKSSLYRGKFSFKSGMKIRAVAVKDRYTDSLAAASVCAITYKLNGGKNNSKNPSSYYIRCGAKLYSPTKKGCQFAGWYRDKKFKKKVAGISAGQTGRVTLYAKWKVKKYTVVFKGNKSTGGKMSDLKLRKYGKSFRLPVNRFERKGYRFVGWNTKANGKGKNYKNKQTVKNLASGSGGKVTLYACWKKKR